MSFDVPIDGGGYAPGYRYFVLDGDKIVQVSVTSQADYQSWLAMLAPQDNHRLHYVDRTSISKDPEVFVATTFSGCDDEPPDNPPKPWQTTVWGGPLHHQTWLYATLAEAKRGHWVVVDLVREAMEQRSSA